MQQNNAKFEDVIRSIISDISTEYNTIGSLEKIIILLEQLNDEEKKNNIKHIKSIAGTIKTFGSAKSSPLSSNQLRTLLRTLRKAVSSDYEDNYNKDCNFTFKVVEKFDPDDIITEIVYSLFTSVNQMMMSSSIAPFVVAYYDEINNFSDVFEENREKYNLILLSIDDLLKMEGWILYKGFKKEPNQKNIVEGLSKIIEKYF
jgi:hypothetical protein